MYTFSVACITLCKSIFSTNLPLFIHPHTASRRTSPCCFLSARWPVFILTGLLVCQVVVNLDDWLSVCCNFCPHVDVSFDPNRAPCFTRLSSTCITDSRQPSFQLVIQQCLQLLQLFLQERRCFCLCFPPLVTGWVAYIIRAMAI